VGGAEQQMPLARYFTWVGSVLLALLFVANAYLPKLPAAGNTEVQLPIIRVHSDQNKWPERIVFDTAAVLPKPSADVITPASPTVAMVSPGGARSVGRIANIRCRPDHQCEKARIEASAPAQIRNEAHGKTCAAVGATLAIRLVWTKDLVIARPSLASAANRLEWQRPGRDRGPPRRSSADPRECCGRRAAA
jgi:hypothetical protein